MTRFATQTDVLAQAAAHVDQVNAEIQTKLSTLAGAVSATAGFWRGETQRTFSTLMERWNADAGRLTDALNAISLAMAQSGAAYASTEERSTAVLRSSGSALTL